MHPRASPWGILRQRTLRVQGQDHTKGSQITAYQSVSTQGTAHTQNQFSSRHVDCVSAWDDVQTFCKNPGGPQRKACSDHLTDTVSDAVSDSARHGVASASDSDELCLTHEARAHTTHQSATTDDKSCAFKSVHTEGACRAQWGMVCWWKKLRVCGL